MSWRNLLAACAIVASCAALVSLPQFSGLDGLSIDTLFWLRQATFGTPPEARPRPTVVVAIDEETYRREPFANTPDVMWTPQLAGVLDAIMDAGAKVIGFDVVYPTSIEPYFRGFERDFLLTLRRGAQDNRIVLGRIQHQQKPISPFAGYSFAVGHGRNIRALNVFEDDDGVIRRIPLAFQTESGEGAVGAENSMAVELASRALGIKPEAKPDGRLALGNYLTPFGEPNTLLLNFSANTDDVPTYSFADLHACKQAGNAEYFRRNFKDKVVFIGAVRDVEDRKLTSKRLITQPEGIGLPERCALPAMHGLYIQDFRRDSIPGVYIHATAVNNLLRGDALASLPRWQSFATILVALAMVAVMTTWLTPSAATIGLLLLTIAWTALCTTVFRGGLVLPWLAAITGGALTFPILLGYRFAIVERSRRQLSGAFSLYLPPAVIDRVLAGDRQPSLGGEMRQVSILFSDVVKFTELSERHEPREIVRRLNDYFGVMASITETHGGFVDKFIGDAVLAVFGAPLDDLEHPLNVVRAALNMRHAMRQQRERLGIVDDSAFAVRIGINTGEVLIGNIGSARRFNYTVMGDAVNLASRIESSNKVYGTDILVSGETMLACGDAVRFREIDTVRVVGRAAPVTLYEPVALAFEVDAEQERRLIAFAAALALWRQGDFVRAERAFAALADTDPVSARYAKRAAAQKTERPAAWDGVTTLTEK